MSVQAIRAAEPAWQVRPLRRSEPPAGPGSIAFGEFVASPATRTLLFRGAPVEIGSRAFDLLIVLLRSRGKIVSKKEIVRQVWPSTIVDESNLRIQMTSLRKVLGNERDRIKTIPGRGYLFATDHDLEADADSEETMVPRLAGHPAPLRRKARPAIVIIDEDPVNRAALHHLLRPFDANVESFVSVAAFLASNAAATDPGAPK